MTYETASVNMDTLRNLARYKWCIPADPWAPRPTAVRNTASLAEGRRLTVLGAARIHEAKVARVLKDWFRMMHIFFTGRMCRGID